jgi:hypothetical protein
MEQPDLLCAGLEVDVMANAAGELSKTLQGIRE